MADGTEGNAGLRPVTESRETPKKTAKKQGSETMNPEEPLRPEVL